MAIIETRAPQYVEHVQGGEGRMLRDPLLSAEQLGGEASFVGQITLEPGCSIGYHQHVGDAELYFVTEGTGTYTEDGAEFQVKKGDAMYCKDGSFHGIANSGTENLSFVAVIQKSK